MTAIRVPDDTVLFLLALGLSWFLWAARQKERNR